MDAQQYVQQTRLGRKTRPKPGSQTLWKDAMPWKSRISKAIRVSTQGHAVEFARHALIVAGPPVLSDAGPSSRKPMSCRVPILSTAGGEDSAAATGSADPVAVAIRLGAAHAARAERVDVPTRSWSADQVSATTAVSETAFDERSG